MRVVATSHSVLVRVLETLTAGIHFAVLMALVLNRCIHARVMLACARTFTRVATHHCQNMV